MEQDIFMPEKLNKAVTLIKTALARSGAAVNESDLQQGLAEAFGAPDWNALMAAAQEREEWIVTHSCEYDPVYRRAELANRIIHGLIGPQMADVARMKEAPHEPLRILPSVFLELGVNERQRLEEQFTARSRHRFDAAQLPELEEAEALIEKTLSGNGVTAAELNAMRSKLSFATSLYRIGTYGIGPRVAAATPGNPDNLLEAAKSRSRCLESA